MIKPNEKVVLLLLYVLLLDGAQPQSCKSEDSGYYTKHELAIRQLTEPVLLGEGPTWDPKTNRLYFLDIVGGRVYNYDPESTNTTFISFDGTVSPLVQSKSRPDQFYVGVNRTLMKITWDGEHEITSQEALTTVSEDFPTSRFNDGKADSRGRLWFGTIGEGHFIEDIAPNVGSLYLITKENLADPIKVITPVNISNGLAWNAANDKFFYIDTLTYNIVQYDYDDESGKISNPKVVINMQEAKLGPDAFPDGMTIDVDDNLWVALYGAGAVLHVNSTDGTIIRRVAMPVQYVSSCMWGGKNLDILFVTTSRIKLHKAHRLQGLQPAAGSLFSVEGLGTRGRPVFGGDI